MRLPRQLPPSLRALEVRNYRLFASGQLLSLTGRWMFATAQDWLVVELGGHGIALGLTTALQFLPTLLFGPWGGVLADRLDKRRVLLATQLGFGVLAAALSTLVLTGVATVGLVWGLALVYGCLVAIDTPTRQAFVPEMVGPGHLTNAVALNSVTFNSARIVGPALAGLLISVFDTGPVFAITAVSYAGVLSGLLRMRATELHPSPRLAKGRGQVREGIAYVRGRPDILLVMAMVAVVGVVGLNFAITLALMAKHFHGGAQSYGLLSSTLAVGSLSGAILATRRARPRQRTLVLACIAFGVAETVAAFAPSALTLALLLIPVGFSVLTFTTTANTSIQLAAGPQMRGRVMALYLFVFLGTTPIGGPLVGLLCQSAGPRAGLALGGLGSLAAGLAAGVWLLRRQCQAGVEHSLRELVSGVVDREHARAA